VFKHIIIRSGDMTCTEPHMLIRNGALTFIGCSHLLSWLLWHLFLHYSTLLCWLQDMFRK